MKHTKHIAIILFVYQISVLVAYEIFDEVGIMDIKPHIFSFANLIDYLLRILIVFLFFRILRMENQFSKGILFLTALNPFIGSIMILLIINLNLFFRNKSDYKFNGALHE